jgi:endoglucanase
MVDPNWGWGNDVDWYSAAQYAADRILNEANPNVLIVIEGINWIGLPVDGLPHGRPTLSPAYYLSHTLMQSNQLVYSAHFYGYTGPNHSGAVGIGETHDPRYRDLSVADLDNAINTEAAYVAGQAEMHFTRPVWVCLKDLPPPERCADF